MSEWRGQATLCLRACRRTARPTVRCMILLTDKLHSFMRASCEYRYVRFERQTVPLYVLMLVYQYQVCDWRAPSTSSIHSSSSANIRNIWSTCGIRSIALPYTTRRVLVLQYWYSHTSECVAVKRCRYHAIRGSVLCTCGTYHTSTDGIPHVCCA